MGKHEGYIAHCRAIADHLETHVLGKIARCPCGEQSGWAEFEQEAARTKYHCFHCGADLEDGELQTVGLADFFTEECNFEYIFEGYEEYRAVRILVACGGPDIYIDTEDKAVQLYWREISVSYPLPAYVVDAVDAYFKDYYENVDDYGYDY